MKTIFAIGWLSLGGLVIASCATGSVASGVDGDDAGAVQDGSMADGAKDGPMGECAMKCTGTTPYCDKTTGTCAACLPTNDTCADGTYCAKNTNGVYACAPGCKTSAECTAGDGGDGGARACCNHACVDTSSSVQNCGMCGNACSGDGGTPACCNSVCVDTTSSAQNCGTCGHACTGDGGAASCCNSTCDDTTTSVRNCGSCGHACTSGMSCVSSMCVTASGTVVDTLGVSSPVTFVPCGNGSVTSCTEAAAETSCTSIGKKLVSHASNGTNAVVSLGATVSCQYSISYFTNTNPAFAGQCLIGVSNAQWTSCCGVSRWHGNIVTIPTTLGQQFGFVNASDSGYQSGLANVSGTIWACIATTATPPTRAGCTTYYVACK